MEDEEISEWISISRNLASDMPNFDIVIDAIYSYSYSSKPMPYPFR